MKNADRWQNLLVGLMGAAAGGVLGCLAFRWIARQGFYALVLPGALAGLGGGLLVKDRSVLRGVVCGLFALGLGFFSDWRMAPFIGGRSFAYYLTHIHLLQPITLIMAAAGGVLGGWLALGKGPATRGRA
ncbi:MAG: hypothetical protein ABSF95_03160 [Verrucomicrobiota bacterium]|jgi:hypothetical protein